MDSFLLSWGERDSDGLESAIPLAPRSTQTLYELGMEGDKKYYLFLLDGPDAPPVKNNDTGAGARSDQGAGSESGGAGSESGGAGPESGGAGQEIGLASSVNTTTPSSHSLNNVSTATAGSSSTSSAWSSSTYHYSNKSDTGIAEWGGGGLVGTCAEVILSLYTPISSPQSSSSSQVL